MLLQRLFQSPGLLLAAASTFIAAAFVVPYWERDFYFDSAVMGGLADSLLSGEGYRFMGREHGKYPPGFPAALALVQWLGLGLRGVHLVVAIGAVASVVLSYYVLRHRHGRWFAFAVAGLTMINHDFVAHQGHVLTDLPFLALALGAMLQAERIRDDPSWRSTIWTALLCVAAASVRSVGLALAPAIFLGLLTRRRPAGEPAPDRQLALRAGIVAAATLVFVGLWLVRGEIVTRNAEEDLLETVPYHQELVRQDAVDESRGLLRFSHVVDRFVYNVGAYARLTGELLDGREERRFFTVSLAIVPIWIGWAIAFWRRREIVDYYFVAYAAMLSVWSGPEGTRFLLGLLPLLYHYLFVALAPWSLRTPSADDGSDDPSGAWSPPKLRRSQVVVAAIVAFTVFTSAWPDFKEWRGHLRRPFYSWRAQEYHTTVAWIRQNVPEDAVFVVDKAPMTHFLTGRLAYKYATTPDLDVVLASIAVRGEPYLLVNAFHSNPHYLIPLIEQRPQYFRELFREGTHAVYRFVPEGDAGDASDAES